MDLEFAIKLLGHPKFLDFQGWIKENTSLVIEELWDSPKSLLLKLASDASQKTLIVLTSGDEGGKLINDLPFFFEGPIYDFPAWETLPEEDIPPSPDVVGQRYHILFKLQDDIPSIIITSLQALLQKLIPPLALHPLCLNLKVGNSYSFETLPQKLSEMGYHRKSVASDKGEFAVRGGIIDIYPVSHPDPYRIEFFGDEIESIRKYDAISQCSVEKCDDLFITPGQELELLASQSELATLLDYVKQKCILVFDDLLSLEDKATALSALKPSAFRFYASLPEILEQATSLQKLFFTDSPLDQLSDIKHLEARTSNPYALLAPPQKISFECFEKNFIAYRWISPFYPLYPSFCHENQNLEHFGTDEFLTVICNLTEQNINFHFLCATPSDEETLHKKIASLNLQLPNTSQFLPGYLSSGFYLAESALVVIPSPEWTHRSRIKRDKQRSYHHTLALETFSFAPGEAVVHQHQGIGRYLGIEKKPNHIGIDTEFLILEYAEGSKLYVPIQQSNLINKYIGATDDPPEFHKIGSQKWKRAKERSQQAVLAYAQDLLKLQAQRELRGGFKYPPDSDMVKQFAKEFPYEETPDQLKAIESLTLDMTSDKAMDRLICGDVGYGKTEVAMRAAFKAVIDGGKQVAVLVPTTVLAMQHHETFSERMAGYPIEVGVLSRFLTPAKQKQLIANLEKGIVDIIIGTHRLISDDVKFKDLGMLIIDEEQRFGVKAKEHLKKIKQEVDCLTLSATPIPRTLYFSLVGAREMSLINTPPADRLPIQTLICQRSDEVIKAALLRELTRDGQAYFIHNRVETIFEVADKLRALLGGARVIVGHGQMASHELDHVFHTFKSGKADILVATSIIENGIDIPNANTILVDRADRFGLADLYQIRGRVGRWIKKAYCYFLVPNIKEMPELSRKRLSALASTSGHEGGMKIALQDLEIRGAGNILGTEQSGHITSIGFHLYCKMLKKAIKALQKQTPLTFSGEIKIDLPFDARLPEDYINETHLRMEIYGRLGEAETFQEVDQLFEELTDRFGLLPLQVQWLKSLSRLKIIALQNRFTLIKMTRHLLEVHQDQGKKGSYIQRMMISEVKSPEKLEPTILAALKKHHFLK